MNTNSINKNMVNPWTSLDNNCKVASIDVTKVNALQNKYKNCFVTSLWPEPFLGDPKAKVYLLNGNPGLTDAENGIYGKESVFTDDPIFSDIMKRNMTCNLNPDDNPFVYPTSGNNEKEHPGKKWWECRLRALLRGLGLSDSSSVSIFNIEFFPYHSRNTDRIKDKDLIVPSSKYTNELIYKAMKDNKLIIIIRKYKPWIKRIKGLENYHNLLVLDNYQNNSLTMGNVLDPIIMQQAKVNGWNRLVNALKQQVIMKKKIKNESL